MFACDQDAWGGSVERTYAIGVLERSRDLGHLVRRNFDRLVHMAASVLRAPMALATLVDEARVWVKAGFGTEAREAPREGAFCSHAITSPDVFVVEDARLDDRFSTSPLVVEAGVCFYAGAPVFLDSGEVVGTLCVLDTVPRPVPDVNSVALLKGLAAAAGHLLDLRRELIVRRATEQRLAERARLIELAEVMAGIGTWRLDIPTSTLHLSPSISEIYGLDPSRPAPDVDTLLAMYYPADRTRIIASIERARTSGEGYTFDARL